MMRLMVFLSVVALAATLALPALAQEGQTQDRDLQPARRPEITIFFITGDAFGSGTVVAVDSATGIATEDLSAVTFVDIRVCDQRHVFAVNQIAPSGHALGATIVTVRNGTMALADVVTALDDACMADHLSVTADELGANMVIPAAVTPPPVVAVDLTLCPDGSLECDIIAQKMESGQETE